MKKFEYKMITNPIQIDEKEQIKVYELIHKAGQEGFKIVPVIFGNGMLLMEREITEWNIDGKDLMAVSDSLEVFKDEQEKINQQENFHCEDCIHHNKECVKCGKGVWDGDVFKCDYFEKKENE